jgi:hypothetical protein
MHFSCIISKLNLCLSFVNKYPNEFQYHWSLSYKTFLADIVVIYDVILTLEKLASIAIVMYENKIELLSKQKKS